MTIITLDDNLLSEVIAVSHQKIAQEAIVKDSGILFTATLTRIHIL